MAEDEVAEPPKVTRSIMIKRPTGCPSPGNNGTPPASPVGSTPPVSPFAGEVLFGDFFFFFYPPMLDPFVLGFGLDLMRSEGNFGIF